MLMDNGVLDNTDLGQISLELSDSIKKLYGFAHMSGGQRQLRIGELTDWTGGDPAAYGDFIYLRASYPATPANENDQLDLDSASEGE